MQQNLMHDVIVIGGGPAGSAAAIQLARAGKSVCLLERKPGAHDKVCGEFISWEAAQYLHWLGLDLPALDAQPIHHTRLYNGEAMLASQLPFTAWSLSRRRLDEALLQLAVAAGATVQRGVTVKDLLRTGGVWTLSVSGKATREKLRANTVFLATGKHDMRNWRRRSRHQQNLIGMKIHLQLTEKQKELLRKVVEIHLFDGGYAGLEPVEEGKTNLCFLISRHIYNACGKHWPSMVEWLCGTSSHLQARLGGSRPLWQHPLAVYAVPYGYLHQATEASLFRLGDQAAVIPSFAGDGIAIALHSAFLATHVHMSGGSANDYHRQARSEFQVPVRNAQMLASLFFNAWGRRAVFLMSRLWPGLMQRAICGIRLDKIQPESHRL